MLLRESNSSAPPHYRRLLPEYPTMPIRPVVFIRRADESCDAAIWSGFSMNYSPNGIALRCYRMRTLPRGGHRFQKSG
jgi:hypothetical protein